MHEVAVDLLILLAGIWLVAVTLSSSSGCWWGPAVFGLIEPSEAITLLAEIGIFFLMFHAGVETQPSAFFDALKRSLGVAIVGAIVPFGVSFGVATAFGLDPVGAVFVGLTMTATAVVITLKTLNDLGLADTRVAQVTVASCVIDDLLTLVFFGLVIGVLSGGSFEPMDVAVTLAKVVAFFGLAVLTSDMTAGIARAYLDQTESCTLRPTTHVDLPAGGSTMGHGTVRAGASSSRLPEALITPVVRPSCTHWMACVQPSSMTLLDSA